MSEEHCHQQSTALVTCELPNCDNTFEQYRPTHRFCSPEHQGLSKPCSKCGGPKKRPGGWCYKCQTTATRNKRSVIIEDAKSRGCSDCGLVEPAIMEFDHVPERGPKSFKIHRSIRAGLGRLRQEMTLCDVVCPNCHRRRTNMRGQLCG